MTSCLVLLLLSLCRFISKGSPLLHHQQLGSPKDWRGVAGQLGTVQCCAFTSFPLLPALLAPCPSSQHSLPFPPLRVFLRHKNRSGCATLFLLSSHERPNYFSNRVALGRRGSANLEAGQRTAPSRREWQKADCKQGMIPKGFLCGRSGLLCFLRDTRKVQCGRQVAS